MCVLVRDIRKDLRDSTAVPGRPRRAEGRFRLPRARKGRIRKTVIASNNPRYRRPARPPGRPGAGRATADKSLPINGIAYAGTAVGPCGRPRLQLFY